MQFEDYQMLADGDFPVQTERARKEMLYRKCIELLDKGQVRIVEFEFRICSCACLLCWNINGNILFPNVSFFAKGFFAVMLVPWNIVWLLAKGI
jgi:hypothetical protein